MPATKPYKLADIYTPLDDKQVKSINDAFEDVYKWLRSGVSAISGLIFTALSTGFTIAGGDPNQATLTVAGDGSVSGTNTGDQTITLTGDVTGSGTGSFPATLATVNSNVGSWGDSTHIPTLTVNAKGLVTAASQTAVVAGQSSAQILTRVMLRN